MATTKKKAKTADVCGFDEAWIGKCQNSIPCEKHANKKCVSCQALATRNCEETGQFVCGFPLCDNCEHAIAPDGTNGGVGFYSTVPDDMRESWESHIPKSKQRYQPWYMREEAADL